MVKYRKLDRKDVLKEPLHRWLAWLDPGSPPELVSEVVSMDSAIQKAQERQEVILSSDESLRNYEMRLKAQLDWNTAYSYAIEEGMEKGIERGIEKERTEIARKMKEMGDTPEKIHAVTGLSLEQIKQI